MKLLTAREYWFKKFGEFPQTDAADLAAEMMSEYGEYVLKEKDNKLDVAPISDMEIISRYPNSDLNCIHDWVDGLSGVYCFKCGTLKTLLHT